MTARRLTTTRKPRLCKTLLLGGALALALAGCSPEVFDLIKEHASNYVTQGGGSRDSRGIRMNDFNTQAEQRRIDRMRQDSVR